MFSHMKSVVNKVSNAIGIRNEDESKLLASSCGFGRLNCGLTYQRPMFLDLTNQEEKLVLDHKLRRLVAPKDCSILPFNAGYCETVNAGKSILNEDCAVALTVILDSLPKTSCDSFEISSGQAQNEEIATTDEEKASSEAAENCLLKPPSTDKDLLSNSENASTDQSQKMSLTNNNETVRDVVGTTLLNIQNVNETGDKPDSNFSKPLKTENVHFSEKGSDAQNSLDELSRQDLKPDSDVVPQLQKMNLSSEKTSSIQLYSTRRKLQQVCVVLQMKCSITLLVQCVLHDEKSNRVNRISMKTYSRTAGKTLRLDYFAIFDGHAGEGAALYASAVLHEILIERLREVQHLLLKENTTNPYLPDSLEEATETKGVTVTSLQADNLIIGLLQDVMLLTDKHMEVDQRKYGFSGGCTVILVVFILGKMYVAGAGDSRAVLYTSSGSGQLENPGIVTTVNLSEDTKIFIRHMSHDFTPVTERRRLQYLAFLKPSLLGEHFVRYEFIRRIRASDVGKRVLHRDYHMTGWTYKEITRDDLRLPMIAGMGRAKRLLATIGVTRGLGDHQLVALNQLADVPVKPFMSAVPEVRVHDLTTAHGPNDVLVMASDGLWDVMTSEMVAKQVTATLQKLDANDPSRYSAAARDLVLTARGTYTAGGGWRMANDKPASVDDITVYVIPLLSASKKHI